jgi:hypothetical protein
MHLSIIVWVAVVSFVGCALIAIAIYLIDKNANRHDKHH